ncbi:uncharacterized protein LOC122641394 isoform X1 [Telopea speciosissima]|uniref:uncharacterized protein LOC122641394 isoform X1 n=1 Tax=Telopea speciosissima TaxID=54955 RepID=UPI001CC5AC76|nr:uncharacterized protein LOC122641394 isoform X1 [Telopea speciosissima]
MSLVDYASSSEDDDAEVREEGEGEERGGTEAEGLEERKEEEPLPSAVNSHNRRTISPSHQQPASASHLPAPSIENLPDASLLLSSPAFVSQQMSGTDHYSKVAAAMAESTSRKREVNGSASSHLQSKLPRRDSPHPRNVPDTASGLLVPPQLSGRSNVVTEDISKLFVKRH